MTDESHNRLSSVHKNNRTLYFANAAYLDEPFIRAVVSGYNSNNIGNKGSALTIQKINMQGHSDEWIMITMSEHHVAKKFWKHLEKKTVAELAAQYKLKVPTPVSVVDSDEDEIAIMDEPLIISWAMNREQRAVHDRSMADKATEAATWVTPKNGGKPTIPAAVLAPPVQTPTDRFVDVHASASKKPPQVPVKVAVPVLLGPEWSDEPVEPLPPIQKPQAFAYLPPMIQQQQPQQRLTQQQPIYPQENPTWFQSPPSPPMHQYQITTASMERGVIGTFYVRDDKYKAICAILFA